MCVEFFRREVNVDQQKATIVEEQTRLQSDDSLWFQQRRLRLTASNFEKVARRRSTTPVANLVKSLLYNKPVNTKGLRWGKDHEVHAESSYKQYLSRLNYQNIDVHRSGLFVYLQDPCLACSPDGLVEYIDTDGHQLQALLSTNAHLPWLITNYHPQKDAPTRHSAAHWLTILRF